VVQEENLQAHALTVGERLLNGLRELQRDHGAIRDVRGSGFFLGVELAGPTEAHRIVNALRDHGILIGTEGPLNNVLKIRPPMPFSTTDAGHFLATLRKVI
jgi:4-aminobutyrate aminotransferase-like enzyme